MENHTSALTTVVSYPERGRVVITAIGETAPPN